jgi:hypothetical protein
MGKRLGKIQRQILYVLKHRLEDKHCSDWTPVTWLTCFVFHPDRFYDDYCKDNYWFSYDKGDVNNYSRSEYISTHRAVKRLEEMDLVETKRIVLSGLEVSDEHGGSRHYKEVRIINTDVKSNLD